MLIEFLRFLGGSVQFKVKGEFPERFLNQLAQNKVSVWGLRRSSKEITAFVSVRDYLRFHTLKAKNRITTRIVRREGLPFLTKRYRLRIGFAAGLVFYVALLFFLSSFIWNIRVVGNKSVPTEEILSVCREMGLFEGARRSSVDPATFKIQLPLKCEKVAWASVNIEGVRATVNISESKGDKKDPEMPCDLVAEFDGVVTALKVTDGTIKVKVGQTVKKGDLLVSGITEYKDGAYRFGVSAGEVFGETQRELTCFVPFAQEKVVRVGEPIKRRVITFFGVKIPLYLGSVKKPYETETEQKVFEKDGMYLPVKLTETSFFRTQTEQYTLSEDEARQKCAEELLKKEQTDLKNAEILEKTVEFEVTTDGIRAFSKYKCRQNIAKKDLLLILEEK